MDLNLCAYMYSLNHIEMILERHNILSSLDDHIFLSININIYICITIGIYLDTNIFI